MLFAVILLLAAGLRFWNVDYDSDLSQTFSGDAREKFENAKLLATTGEIPSSTDYRSQLYRQPLFLIRSYGAIWKATILLGLDGSDGQMREGFTAYVILYSLGTTALVYLIGKTISGERNQALFATLLFAVFPVNVVGSLYVKEDIPLMFWFTAAIGAMAALVQTGRKKYYLWIGPLIGMAIATKYTGLLLLPIFLVAHLIVVFQTPKDDRIMSLIPWQAFAALGLCALAFLIFNPQVFTEWPDFLEGFLYQIRYARYGHQDGTAIRGQAYWWTFYLRYAIFPGITVPVTLFFLSGLVLSFVRKNRPAILVSITTVLIYFQFENSVAKPFPFFARYLHIVYPLMAVLVAFTFFELWRYLQRGKITRLAGIAIGLILILFPLCKSIILAAGVHSDTRDLAARWIEENLPPESRILMGSRSYSPQNFAPSNFEVTYDVNIHTKSVQKLIEKEIDYIVVNSFQYDRYQFSRKFTEEAQEAYEAYELYERELELIKLFQPRFSFQSYGQHNPIIRIYKIPPDK